MFLGAKEFKGVGLDKWQLSSMTRVDQMFDGATNFNKNLCAWGEQASFSYNRVDDMFVNSGCTFKDDPTRANKGPFCASRCEPGWQDEIEEEEEVVEKEPVLTWAPTGNSANTEPNPAPASDPSEPSITWETDDETPAPTEAPGDDATPAPTDFPESKFPPPPAAEEDASSATISSHVGMVGAIIVGYALFAMV